MAYIVQEVSLSHNEIIWWNTELADGDLVYSTASICIQEKVLKKKLRQNIYNMSRLGLLHKHKNQQKITELVWLVTFSSFRSQNVMRRFGRIYASLFYPNYF